MILLADAERSKEAFILWMAHQEYTNPPPEEPETARAALIFHPDKRPTEFNGAGETVEKCWLKPKERVGVKAARAIVAKNHVGQT